MADFKQAVEWMKKGDRVERRAWRFGYESHVFLKDGRLTFKCKNGSGEFEEKDWTILDIRGFEATDWEIYKTQTCNKCTREYSGDSCSHCKEELTTSGEYNYGDITFSDPFDNNIQLNTKDCNSIIELKDNGDIYVKGKLIENDKEVVDGMRELLGFNERKKV